MMLLKKTNNLKMCIIATMTPYEKAFGRFCVNAESTGHFVEAPVFDEQTSLQSSLLW